MSHYMFLIIYYFVVSIPYGCPTGSGVNRIERLRKKNLPYISGLSGRRNSWGKEELKRI